MKEEKLIFFDTETTDSNTETGGVIQISGIVEINQTIEEEFNLFCNIYPGDTISDEALEKNGLYLDLIKTFPRPSKTFIDLKKILRKYIDQYDPTDKFVAIAYVADFDNRVLRRFFQKNVDQYSEAGSGIPG
jgi:DNA polymerase III epsilon subunit-like protein